MMTVQGESTGVGALIEGETADGVTNIDGYAQGGERNRRTIIKAADMGRGAVQIAVPAESRFGVSAHSFWKWGTTAMFDIRTFNLDVGSYLSMTPKKALPKAYKYKKDLYLQACLECRRFLTLIVYSAYGIPIEEALAEQRRLSVMLIFKLKR